MKPGDGVTMTFVPRQQALEPAAAVALGPVARRLGERLLLLSDAELRELLGVVGAGVIAVLGPKQALPWVNGISYLGQDLRAPRLLVPTALEPFPFSMEVFENAIIQLGAELAVPLAVVASPPIILSLAEALPIRRERLLSWMEASA